MADGVDGHLDADAEELVPLGKRAHCEVLEALGRARAKVVGADLDDDLVVRDGDHVDHHAERAEVALVARVGRVARERGQEGEKGEHGGRVEKGGGRAVDEDARDVARPVDDGRGGVGGTELDIIAASVRPLLHLAPVDLRAGPEAGGGAREGARVGRDDVDGALVLRGHFFLVTTLRARTGYYLPTPHRWST